MPTRRTVLTAFSALALSACAGPQSAAPDQATAAPDEAMTAVNTVTQAAAPTPTPPPAPPVPALGQIQAQFGARVPHRWGLDVPGVVTRAASGSVALTFDACGGPGGTGYDDRLIAALRKNKVPATLFLNARWIAANPQLSAELAADPLFEIGDHGTAHRPLSVNGRSAYGISGTASLAAVYDELLSNRAHLAQLVPRPTVWYRPGTAYFDEVAAEVTRAVGLIPVNFSVNGDAGATFTPAQVVASVSPAGPGDVVISHMNRPGSGTAPGYETVLPRMLERGVTFTTLSKAGLATA